MHDRTVGPDIWFPRYIQTYINRDVRSLRQVGDLLTFQKFVCLCAGRIGQLTNFSKRLVKQPKLYFTDTGLACSLLGIESADQLESHYLRGGLFENAVVVEFLKCCYNAGKPSNLTFWRDHLGRDIDLIATEGDQLHAIKIKSGAPLNASFFESLEWFGKTADSALGKQQLVYGGDHPTQRGTIKIFPWFALSF